MELCGNYEIYVMSWDGKNQHNITNSPEDDRDPYWDYNTDADIFFVRDVGGAGEVSPCSPTGAIRPT